MAGLFHPLDRGVENFRQVIDNAGDGRVWTDCPARSAGGTLLGIPLGVVEANAGHVAKDASDSRHHTQADERIGDVVITHAARIKIACLFPEAVNIRKWSVALWLLLEHHRKRRFDLGNIGLAVGGCAARSFVFDLVNFIKAAPDNPHVIFNNACAFVAEFVLELIADGFEQGLFGQAFCLHHR